MGSMGAIGMAGAVHDGQVTLDAALEWHLHSNHFPPIHRDFIAPAKRAIELAERDEWDERIEMPNGKVKTVDEIVEGLHLHAFIDTGEEP